MLWIQTQPVTVRDKPSVFVRFISALQDCGQQLAREEFVVAGFIEPCALDIKEPEAGNEARERERIDRQLRDGLVRAGIRLVVEYVDRAVAGLQEVDVSGDMARLVAGIRRRRIERFPGHDRDAVFVLKRRDIVLAKPDRNLHSNRDAVVGEHEALQFGMPVAVGADARNDKRRRVGGGVALFHQNEAIKGEEVERQFRGASPSSLLKISWGQDRGTLSRKSASGANFVSPVRRSSKAQPASLDFIPSRKQKRLRICSENKNRLTVGQSPMPRSPPLRLPVGARCVLIPINFSRHI